MLPTLKSMFIGLGYAAELETFIKFMIYVTLQESDLKVNDFSSCSVVLSFRRAYLLSLVMRETVVGWCMVYAGGVL